MDIKLEVLIIYLNSYLNVIYLIKISCVADDNAHTPTILPSDAQSGVACFMSLLPTVPWYPIISDLAGIETSTVFNVFAVKVPMFSSLIAIKSVKLLFRTLVLWRKEW